MCESDRSVPQCVIATWRLQHVRPTVLEAFGLGALLGGAIQGTGGPTHL